MNYSLQDGEEVHSVHTGDKEWMPFKRALSRMKKKELDHCNFCNSYQLYTLRIIINIKQQVSM